MGEIKIGKIVLGMCQTNCYFIYREGDKNDKGLIPTIVIDPADQGAYLHRNLQNNGFDVAGILLTHGHFDHIWGASEMRSLASCKMYGSKLEEDVFTSSSLNVSAQAGKSCTVKVNELLKDGDVIEIAGMSARLISTPGHTQGSCCFYFEEPGFLVSGDTLFAESVGRTDLPTGSMQSLVQNIKKKLFVLPEETLVYPGHGDATTIGYEKKNNPFVV
ncbi:MAG: MBL fold metallo-hydrolase [Lachnospiraceae bacterium]